MVEVTSHTVNGCVHGLDRDQVDCLQCENAEKRAESESEPVELYERMADLLYDFGWRARCDSQWGNLKQGLPKLRELLSDDLEVQK